MAALSPTQRGLLVLAFLAVGASAVLWTRRWLRDPQQPQPASITPVDRSSTDHAKPDAGESRSATAGVPSSPLQASIRRFVAAVDDLLDQPAPQEPEREVLRRIHELEGSERGAEREHGLRALLRKLGTDSESFDRIIAIARSDPDGDVRRLAVIALGRTSRPAAMAALRRLTETGDVESRRLAILSLSQAQLDPYAHWDDEQLNCLTVVSARMTKLYGADIAEHFLRLADREPDPRNLCVLASVLGGVLAEPSMRSARSQDKRLDELPILDKLAALARSHPHKEVRLVAVNSLQHTRCAAAGELLADLALRDPDDDVRATALGQLHREFDTPRVKETLDHIVVAERNPRMLALAVEAVRLVDANGARRDVLGHLATLYSRTPDRDLRASILRALAREATLGHHHVRQLASSEVDPQLRDFALRLLK